MNTLENISVLKAVLLLLTCTFGFALKSGIRFSPNQKFTYGNKAEVHISSAIQSMNNTYWLYFPFSITIVYQRAADFGNINAVALIKDIAYSNPRDGIWCIVLQRDIKPTQMTIDIKTTNALKLFYLTISYIYFQIPEQYANTIHLQSLYYESFPRVYSESISSIKNFTFSFPGPENTTASTKIIVFLNGIGIYMGEPSYTYDLQITTVLSKNVTITLSTSYHKEIYLFTFLLKVCFFNSQPVASSSSLYYHIYSGIITSEKFTQSDIQMTNFNTIVGLNSFSLVNSDVFSFYTSINDSEVSISHYQPASSYVFYYLTLYSNYCDYKTPYYYYGAKQCCDICPGQLTADNLSLTCRCLQNNTIVDSSYCVPSSQDNYSIKVILIGSIVGVVGVTAIAIIICLINRSYFSSSTQRIQCGKVIKHNLNEGNGPQNRVQFQSELKIKQNQDTIQVEHVQVNLEQNTTPQQDLAL